MPFIVLFGLPLFLFYSMLSLSHDVEKPDCLPLYPGVDKVTNVLEEGH
jgi:hypothetical protein